MSIFKFKKIFLMVILSILLFGHGLQAMDSLIDQLCQATLTCKDLQEIKRLLDAGANINGQSGVRGTTPLYNACQAGSETAVLFLINEGAIIDGLTDDGYTPILAAVINDHIAIVQILISLGAPINQGDIFFNKTPLHFASKKGNAHIAHKLLVNGAQVDARDKKGKTPIFYAVEAGHIDVIKLLIKFGAQVNIEDTYERTPLSYAQQENVASILKAAGNPESSTQC